MTGMLSADFNSKDAVEHSDVLEVDRFATEPSKVFEERLKVDML